MRSMRALQPGGPWRCCTAISTLWQITQRLTTRSQPSVCGSGARAAAARIWGRPRFDTPKPATVAAMSVAAARPRLGHFDLDGVDDIPAIAERIGRAARRLDPAQAVRRPRHERVRPRPG